jgi:hypothetical protein
MNAQHAGYIITVYPLAHGWWKYQATSIKHFASGMFEAFDDADAIDKVMQLIDNDEI